MTSRTTIPWTDARAVGTIEPVPPLLRQIMGAHMTHRTVPRAFLRSIALSGGLVLLAVIAATGSSHAAGAKVRPNPYAYLPKVPSFTVVSTSVKDGYRLPPAQLSGVFGAPGGKD